MFILKFIDPSGAESYWPVGFGFTSHEHAASIEGAERFPTEANAMRCLNGYWYPAAFWESERKHRENQIKRFRRWSFEIMEVK